MAQKLSGEQVRRIEQIQEFQKVVNHVKRLVGELDSNRAAKPKIIQNISASIARELSQMRQRSLAANIGQLADVAGALGVLAARVGNLGFKIRGLNEGIVSMNLQLDQSLKAAQAPDQKGGDEPTS